MHENSIGPLIKFASAIALLSLSSCEKVEPQTVAPPKPKIEARVSENTAFTAVDDALWRLALQGNFHRIYEVGSERVISNTRDKTTLRALRLVAVVEYENSVRILAMLLASSCDVWDRAEAFLWYQKYERSELYRNSDEGNKRTHAKMVARLRENINSSPPKCVDLTKESP